ncbi:hypothetical protein ACIQOW_24735 [Kitasatospora sp. NPDC091335]
MSEILALQGLQPETGSEAGVAKTNVLSHVSTAFHQFTHAHVTAEETR